MEHTHTELLASLLSAHPGSRLDLTIASMIETGVVVFLVAIRSTADPDGVVIGKGLTRNSALVDAEGCLQGALDSIDVARIKDQ